MPRKYVPKPKKIVKVAPRKKYTKKPMRMYRRPSTVPFPKIKNCTLVYKQPSAPITCSVLNKTVIQRYRLNSLYDFDYDDTVGNKQPLYFDQLFNLDGPYKQYKVNAWKTTITVTNLSAANLNVYYDQGVLNSITDSDTAPEMQNRPGVYYKMLTSASNAKPQVTFTSYKSIRSFAAKPSSSGSDYSANYQGNPTSTVTGTLLVTHIDPLDTSSWNILVSVTHKYYVTCFQQDGTIS